MSDKLTVRSLTGNYDVIFIDNFAEVLNNKYKEGTFFIIDERLIDLYKDRFTSILNKECYIPVEVKEQNKTLDYCQNLIQSLIGKNIRKNYTLVALGGGASEPEVVRRDAGEDLGVAGAERVGLPGRGSTAFGSK